MQLKKCITNDTKFLFDKTQFKNFVDIIPYMAFDNYFVCQRSRITEHIYLTPFNITRSITYFKCKSTIILKENSELLYHLKPLIDIITFYIFG